jgi:hypothetical protein
LDEPIWLEIDYGYEESNQLACYEIDVNKCDSDGDSVFLTKLDQVNVILCTIKIDFVNNYLCKYSKIFPSLDWSIIPSF